MLSDLRDIWRHTFPKNLRYCRQCIILHAQLSSLVARFKYKKYIPRREIADLVNSYQPLACSKILGLPIVRSILFLRLINGFRTFRGHPCWLISKAVIIEHEKFAKWVEKNATQQYVEREKFTREVINEFHVATSYHRGFRFFMFVVFLAITFLAMAEVPEHVVYAYLRWYGGLNRKEIIEWYSRIVEQHAIAHYTESYKEKLPSPCLLSAIDGYYYLQTVIMIDPEKAKTILFIPFPHCGSKAFMRRVGDLAIATCDGIVLEGVPLENLQNLPPAAYFPLKDDLFPILKLHHRFWDIIRKDQEPPKLYSGSKYPCWWDNMIDAVCPFACKTLYFPFYSGNDRSDARVGWGRIKEALADDNVRDLCVPWSIRQIANLEASLLRQGWKLKNGPKVRWMKPDEIGTVFCDHFGITE